MPKQPERLFPFASRARILVVGRENLARLRKTLHFVLITNDISDNSRREIHSDYAGIPIVQRYSSEQLAGFFGFRNCKVIGFRKSDLAVSILRELKNSSPE